jgi:hypothetical protein
VFNVRAEFCIQNGWGNAPSEKASPPRVETPGREHEAQGRLPSLRETQTFATAGHFKKQAVHNARFEIILGWLVGWRQEQVT